jgi:hypothetical protein
MNRFRDLFEKWHPYWNWECFKSGMWTKRKNEMNKIQHAANILSTEAKCREAMIGAVNAYPISAEQHLSKSQGKPRGLVKRLAALLVAQPKKKRGLPGIFT